MEVYCHYVKSIAFQIVTWIRPIVSIASCLMGVLLASLINEHVDVSSAFLSVMFIIILLLWVLITYHSSFLYIEAVNAPQSTALLECDGMFLLF